MRTTPTDGGNSSLDLGADLTLLRQKATHYVASAATSSPQLGDVFYHLAHDRKALDAIQMLCVSGISVHTLVQNVNVAGFNESVAFRLLSRATVLSIISPLINL